MYNRVIEVIIQLMKNLSDVKSKPDDINLVRENLTVMGYTNEEITAALVWLLKRIEFQAETGTVLPTYMPPRRRTYRILHEVEEMIITPEAYGYLIQLEELGLIDRDQTELIIERAMRFEGQDVGADDMKLIIASILFDPEYIGWQNHSLLMSSLVRDQETVH